MNIKKAAFAALTAAAYAALTILLAPISYGIVQFRISEVLCILPFFFPFSVWGLFIGCILANLISAYGIIDVVFGSLATLGAAAVTYRLGQSKRSDKILIKFLAVLPPVLFNAIVIGAVISITSVPGSGFWAAFVINALQVGVEEFAVMVCVGFPLMVYLPKTGFFNKVRKRYNI